MKERIALNKKGEDLTLAEAFEKFITVKKALNLSEYTIAGYDGTFRYFTEFVDKETLVREIQDDTFFDFIEYLKQRNNAITHTSVNSYLRNLRAIFYFFMEKGYMPKYNIKLIKSKKGIKETYTDEELKRLLIKPKINECDFSEYRNWVLVCYFLGTGNRLNTVCNLKIGDIDFENSNIHLREVKNKKSYIIPLTVSLEKTLREYLEYRGGNATHYIRADSLEEVVKLELSKMMQYLKDNEETFIALLAKKTAKDAENERKIIDAKLSAAKSRNKVVSDLYEKTYEDNAIGKITDERFMQLSHKYDIKQSELKITIRTLENELLKLEQTELSKDNFISAIRRFMQMDKLTPNILRELIEKIEVYHIEGVGKNRTQRIMVHYKFIGVLEMPQKISDDVVTLEARQGVAVSYHVKAG